VSRPAWRRPAVLGAAGVAVAAGIAQFAVTASLADIAAEFGEGAGGGRPVDGGAGGGSGLGGQVATEIGMTGTEIGLGLALIRLASLGALPAAGLADRLGRRTVLLVSAGAGLAITAAAALAPGFWSLVLILSLARPLLGAVNAVAGVVAAEEASHRDRAAAVAVVGAAYAAGTGIVSVVRAVGEDVLGFRGVFALSLLPLLALPLVARWVRESPLYRRPAEPRRLGGMRRGLRGRLAVVCALHLAVGLVLGPVYTYLFVYGEAIVGASPGAMAGLVVAAGPAGLVGLLVGRWLADRTGRRPTAAATMALAALSAVLAYTGGFAALGAGYLLTIALGAAYTPAAGTLDAELFPTEERATAAGWVAAAQVLGQVAGLLAFGALADAFGGFTAAAAALWLPVPLVAGLYALLPETLGRELDEVPGQR
jgi:MFS family permease